MSGPQNTYDVSATERKILLARAARREKLRHEYLKEIGNPYRQSTGQGGTVFDAGLQRFQAMRATHYQYFRPNVRNAFFYIGAVLFPIALAEFIIIGSRDAQEDRYRTGQISYRDREFKFT